MSYLTLTDKFPILCLFRYIQAIRAPRVYFYSNIITIPNKANDQTGTFSLKLRYVQVKQWLLRYLVEYGKSISFAYLCILSGLTFVISTLPQYGATFTDLPVVGLIKALFFLQLKQYSHVYFKYKMARFAIMCLVYWGRIDCIEDIVPPSYKCLFSYFSAPLVRNSSLEVTCSITSPSNTCKSNHVDDTIIASDVQEISDIQ